MKPAFTQGASIAVLLACLTGYSCVAAVFTLTFEGLTPGAFVGNYYNGEAGGDYGIAFYTSDKAPVADGPVADAPSPTIVMRPGNVYSPTTCMNVANGLLNAVTFSYLAPTQPGQLEVWSGIDGTGTMLGSLVLDETSTWTEQTLSFSGLAQSVHFGANANVLFDNVSVEVVPEAGSVVTVSFLFGVIGLRVVHSKLRPGRRRM